MDKNKCYVCQKRKIEKEQIFCSIECAVYSGCYSITKGWIKNVEKYKNKLEKITNSLDKRHFNMLYFNKEKKFKVIEWLKKNSIYVFKILIEKKDKKLK